MQASAPCSPTTFLLVLAAGNYRTLDPGGGADLPGVSHDAYLWTRVLPRLLGIPRDNVAVVHSPALGQEPILAWDGAVAATRANILAALTALGERLRARPGSTAVVTWSGHGVAFANEVGLFQGSGQGLCPADVVQGADGRVDNIIHRCDLYAALAGKALAEPITEEDDVVFDNTTFIFDTCYVPTQRPGQIARSPAALGAGVTSVGAPAPGTLAFEECQKTRGRMLLAAQYTESAYEVHGDRGWGGAFTMAMTTLMQRWSTVPQDGVRRLNVSHTELIYRAGHLLDIVGLPQRPRVSGPPTIMDLPVFAPGLTVALGATSREPDARALRSQLSGEQSGFIEYHFVIEGTSPPHFLFGALVVAPGAPGAARTKDLTLAGAPPLTPASSREFWFCSPAGLSAQEGQGKLIEQDLRIISEVHTQDTYPGPTGDPIRTRQVPAPPAPIQGFEVQVRPSVYERLGAALHSASTAWSAPSAPPLPSGTARYWWAGTGQLSQSSQLSELFLMVDVSANDELARVQWFAKSTGLDGSQGAVAPTEISFDYKGKSDLSGSPPAEVEIEGTITAFSDFTAPNSWVNNPGWPGA